VSIIDETKFVERFQFFNGQRLFAADLQGLDEFNRQMRWLHNQSLHQPGVGSGYAVNGKKGDREVTIGAGYAVDAGGREIILTETFTLPIPPIAGDKGKPIFFDLAVSYPDDAALEEAETREGICIDRGVIRLREVPVFCWIELAGDQLAPRKQKLKFDLQNGLRIRLARIAVLDCQLYADVSLAERLNARPAPTPYIFSATEAISSLEEFNAQIVPVPAVAATFGLPVLISGKVNTSAAEFLTTPEYQAHFAGDRQFLFGADVVVVLDQFQITIQQSESFNFLELMVVAGTKMSQSRAEDVLAKIRLEWKLLWMGIEG